MNLELLTGEEPLTLTRRGLGRLLASVGVAALSIPLVRGRAAAGTPPTFYTWEEYNEPGLFAGYEATHGSAPLLQTFSDENAALNALKGGFSVDVAHPCADQIGHWREADLLQPIDTARLAQWPNLFDSLKVIPGMEVGGQRWWVPLDWGTSTVIYRPDLVPDPEPSYSLLWNESYAGRLAIDEDASITMIVAGLVAGVRDPFEMSDEELVRVKALLERQKPLLRLYWSDDTVIEEAMASGEVVATTCWMGPYAGLRERGVPVEILKPREGMLTWCCGLVLTKTARDLNAAYELMDYLLGAEAGAWFLNYGAGHANAGSYERVDRALLAKHGLDDDPAKTLSESIVLRHAPRMADYQSLFDEVTGV